jgi:hypothetical protein
MLVSGGEHRGGGGGLRGEERRGAHKKITKEKGVMIGLKTWERGEEREVEGGTRGRRGWLQSDFKNVEKC